MNICARCHTTFEQGLTCPSCGMGPTYDQMKPFCIIFGPYMRRLRSPYLPRRGDTIKHCNEIFIVQSVEHSAEYDGGADHGGRLLPVPVLKCAQLESIVVKK